MTSIPAVGRALHDVLTTQADQIARQTGCVQRQRRFAGGTLVQTLVFGWRSAPDASLSVLTQMAARRGVTISVQGLAQRFTAALAATLQQVLAAALRTVVTSAGLDAALLTRFPGGVWIVDSSVVPLPEALAPEWPGCGGEIGQGHAGLKAHLRVNLTTGALDQLDLTPSRASDRGSAVQHAALPPGSLRLHDRQYVTLAVLRDLATAGGFWLSRYHATAAITDPDGTAWADRAQRLEELAAGGTTVDTLVRLGATDQVPARLLAYRLPQEQADRARAQLRRRAQRNGYTPRAEALALAGWLLVITNVPVGQLSLAEALVLLRARWQIERLFRRWKQQSWLEHWRSAASTRILCEVLAKLLACLLDHWLLVVSCWELPRRSLDRASTAIGQGITVLATVFDQPLALLRELRRLVQIIRATCRITQRRQHPNLLQLLADPPEVA